MEYLQLLSTKQVDGIILCSLENPWEDVEPYLQHYPIVLCNEYIEEANIPTVKFTCARSIHRREAKLIKDIVILFFAVVTKPKSLASAEKWALRAITEKSRRRSD